MARTLDIDPQRHGPSTLEELRRLPGLLLRSRVLARGVLAGMHRSARPGVGTDFSHHSPYTPGDAPGAVDWRLYARTRELFVRRYHHETQVTAVLAVDGSASMDYRGDYRGGYGAGPFNKYGYAALLAATLAHVLTAQMDRVGLVSFSDEVRHLVPPRCSGPHVRLVCERLEKLRPAGGTDFDRALRVAGEMAGGRSLILVFSDLLDGDGTQQALARLAHRGHDVVVFHVLDADELDFPFRGAHTFVDPESGARVRADRRGARQRYLERLQDWLERTRKAALGEGIDYRRVSSAQPPAEPLLAFVHGRGRGR